MSAVQNLCRGCRYEPLKTQEKPWPTPCGKCKIPRPSGWTYPLQAADPHCPYCGSGIVHEVDYPYTMCYQCGQSWTGKAGEKTFLETAGGGKAFGEGGGW